MAPYFTVWEDAGPYLSWPRTLPFGSTPAPCFTICEHPLPRTLPFGRTRGPVREPAPYFTVWEHPGPVLYRLGGHGPVLELHGSVLNRLGAHAKGPYFTVWEHPGRYLTVSRILPFGMGGPRSRTLPFGSIRGPYILQIGRARARI